MGRPDPAGSEDISVARQQRIKRLDDRSLLVANHPHFLEVDADCRQIFRDIADVLVLGAAQQNLVADHQERGCDNFFGSGRVGGRHDHLRTCGLHRVQALTTADPSSLINANKGRFGNDAPACLALRRLVPCGSN